MPHKPTVPEKLNNDDLLYEGQSLRALAGKINEILTYLFTQEEEEGVEAEDKKGNYYVDSRTEEERRNEPEFSITTTRTTPSPQEKGWEKEFDKSFYKFQVYAPSDNYDIQTGANDIKNFIKKTFIEREKVREWVKENKKIPTEDQEYGLEFDEGWDDALDEVLDFLDHMEG